MESERDGTGAAGGIAGCCGMMVDQAVCWVSGAGGDWTWEPLPLSDGWEPERRGDSARRCATCWRRISWKPILAAFPGETGVAGMSPSDGSAPNERPDGGASPGWLAANNDALGSNPVFCVSLGIVSAGGLVGFAYGEGTFEPGSDPPDTEPAVWGMWW